MNGGRWLPFIPRLVRLGASAPESGDAKQDTERTGEPGPRRKSGAAVQEAAGKNAKPEKGKRNPFRDGRPAKKEEGTEKRQAAATDGTPTAGRPSGPPGRRTRTRNALGGSPRDPAAKQGTAGRETGRTRQGPPKTRAEKRAGPAAGWGLGATTNEAARAAASKHHGPAEDQPGAKLRRPETETPHKPPQQGRPAPPASRGPQGPTGGQRRGYNIGRLGPKNLGSNVQYSPEQCAGTVDATAKRLAGRQLRQNGAGSFDRRRQPPA